MSTGFTFGGNPPPAFGTGSITFGTPATQPQQFGFGALPTTTPGLFGTATATTTAALGGFKPAGFGTATTTPGTGFGFGTAPAFGTPASTAPTTGFSFGAPTNTGLTFGTPATTAAPTAMGFKPPSTGISFGTPASTGLPFGTPASTGLSFGTPGSTGLTFGTQTTSAAPGTGITFGTATSTPATGLSFGATTSAPPTLGLNFGAASTAAPSLSFGAPTTGTGFSFGASTGGLGLGGVAATTCAALTPTATTQQNVGLGGIAFTQSRIGTTTTQKELPPKEQLLPNEFSQLVERYKNVVQEEKNRSIDVARCSVKEYHKVERELDALAQLLNQVENQLLNNRNLAEKLKYDTAKGLQHVELAQHTQDTPPSLQYDNTAPLQYFLDLADSFERQMQELKVKIDNTDKFVKKCHEPDVLTSQDLVLGLKRLHETFVALAGRMQSIHSQVEAQKEMFLKIRKNEFKDISNPFQKTDRNFEAMNIIMKNALKATPPCLASGPTPFNSMALGSNNMNIAAQQTQPAPFQIIATTASALGFGLGLGNTVPNFGTPAPTPIFKPTGFGSTPFQLNTSNNFQLQKPPTGNKRGKQ